MHLKSFLDALAVGSTLAGLLAGCSSSSTPFAGQDGGLHQLDAHAAADATPQLDQTMGLPRLPGDLVLTCSGPEYPSSGFGYHGRCCERLICRAPVDGACPPGDGKTYGSGSCQCGDFQTKGPYEAAEDDPHRAKASGAGSCCYVTASISCDGRPLNIEDQVRVAGIVQRGDWV